jgi:hypothetical protein
VHRLHRLPAADRDDLAALTALLERLAEGEE